MPRLNNLVQRIADEITPPVRRAVRRGGVAAVLLALGACGFTPRDPFPGLPRLTVSTQFNLENLCDVGLSPLVKLGNVPDGTANYVVQITDVNVLIQTPWRETIPFASKTEIPEGAAKTYAGPCLGDFVRFAPLAPYGYIHRVEVLAEDADSKPLAYGTISVYVQSAYLAARIQRLRQQGIAVSGPPPVVPNASPLLTPGTVGLPGSNLMVNPAQNMSPYQ